MPGIAADLTRDVLLHLEGAAGLWLFLDYDGTLAEFAPTPDTVIPDPKVIRLLERLVDRMDSAPGRPPVRVAVISGRSLVHIRALLPLPGLLLAGVYGVELYQPETGELIRLGLGAVQSVLDALRPRWAELIAGRKGFYLEDKVWSLALHARFALDVEAEQILAEARSALDGIGEQKDLRVLGGNKFLEVGPALADKGQTVAYLLERFAWPGALPVYIGDDDKDEEAFAVIKEHGGIAVVVAASERPTLADYRLESPLAVHAWLDGLIRCMADFKV